MLRYSFLGGDACQCLPEARQYLIGQEERLDSRPAEPLPGEPYFLLAQRSPMGLIGILLVRAAVADMCSPANQRRPALVRPRPLQRCVKRRHIVTVVYVFTLPATGGEASHHVLAPRH